MRLNKNNPYPIIKSTPEMEEKIRKLNKRTIQSLKYYEDRIIGDMQTASMETATMLDYSSRYGTDDFGMEDNPKTKKKGSR